MIHETLGGGFWGALVIFGGVYAGIIVAGVAGCVVLGKIVEKLQNKPTEAAESGGASS